ncbi:hypothetical protein FRC07_010900 [Ceratobasidium sp. 392]|nr:hypothetical protein FRC07_010900 [Ceratobasidium sp. 392]
MPAVNISTSTVSFPSSVLAEHNNPSSPVATVIHPGLPSGESSTYARTSRSSLRASALEVHDLVWLAESSGNVAGRLNRLYESDAVYKNTFVTATSLPLISDIHALTHRLCHLQVPRPTALLARMFGQRQHKTTGNQMWDAWKVWSEIGTSKYAPPSNVDGRRTQKKYRRAHGPRHATGRVDTPMRADAHDPVL